VTLTILDTTAQWDFSVGSDRSSNKFVARGLVLTHPIAGIGWVYTARTEYGVPILSRDSLPSTLSVVCLLPFIWTCRVRELDGYCRFFTSAWLQPLAVAESQGGKGDHSVPLGLRCLKETGTH
jgi:hypothetical protein